MGLGLCLLGTLTGDPPPDIIIDRLVHWAARRLPDTLVTRGTDGDDRPTLFVDVHPAAENVELVAVARGRLVASANTSTVGPGYHSYVVGLLDSLAADLGVAWELTREDGDYGDETSYFERRDFAELQREMLAWLHEVAKQLEKLDGTSFDIAMPTSHRFEQPAFARTPLGPRDRAWFEAVARTPEDGIDFFSWWNEGVTADHHLSVALSLMWSQIRWRAPNNDAEQKCVDRVVAALGRAFQLDARGPYPFREWAELVNWTEHAEPPRQWLQSRASEQDAGAPLIGYRRHPVRVALTAGWSLRLPGSFSEEWDENGTLCAWEGTRTIWFTSFQFDDSQEPPSERPPSSEVREAGEHFHRSDGALSSHAVLVRIKENGQSSFSLKTTTTLPSRRAICTICFDDECDRDWALETWKSLTHPESGQPSEEA
ncbi:MAG TPA: hypothetical protein VJT73_17160 [Polyangiaceae bacterium]|nr:hypothetical protein [Polyangiaceae bacterium]